jgi:hypothetical protein
VCGGENGGKWTCAGCTGLVNVHRDLLRNLQEWRVLYTNCEVPDVLMAADGREYCLWDIERFYEARSALAARAAARLMGISPTSPVSIYATVGLSRLLGMAARGEIKGYRLELIAA